MIFGLSIVKKMSWKKFGRPTFSVNDVKSIHFEGYATAGCIETVHLTSLESALAVAQYHSFSMIKLNPNIDYKNEYGLKESTISKIKAMDEETLLKAYEKAWDKEELLRCGRITRMFRTHCKFPVCPELIQYFEAA
jgi:hypothetical protein